MFALLCCCSPQSCLKIFFPKLFILCLLLLYVFTLFYLYFLFYVIIKDREILCKLDHPSWAALAEIKRKNVCSWWCLIVFQCFPSTTLELWISSRSWMTAGTENFPDRKWVCDLVQIGKVGLITSKLDVCCAKSYLWAFRLQFLCSKRRKIALATKPCLPLAVTEHWWLTYKQSAAMKPNYGIYLIGTYDLLSCCPTSMELQTWECLCLFAGERKPSPPQEPIMQMLGSYR